MGLLSTFGAIFSLDTLDYRLTANTLRSSSPPNQRSLSSSHPLSGPGPGPSIENAQSRKTREESSPSRWGTPEFFVYYLVFATAVPMMFKIAMDVSQESHPNYPKYQHLLSAGWIPGRKVDNSDQQYANFRNHIPILFFVLALHSLLRRCFDAAHRRLWPSPPPNSASAAAHSLRRRRLFDIAFALVFLTVLHSLSVLKILFILLVNFAISYFHPSSILVPILTWAFNVAVLFANEYFRGYRFRDILPFLIAGEGAGVGYAMDHFMGGGLLNRWEVSFNITVLRLISYNLDHYWAALRLEQGDPEPGSVLEVGRLTPRPAASAHEPERCPPTNDARPDGGGGHGETVDCREEDEEERLIVTAELKKRHADPIHMSERDRVDTPARVGDYSLLNYLAYTLYTPLYLAGPIVTFNDFVHQLKYSTPTLTVRRRILYALRLVFAILCMEIVLHLIYVVAISKTSSSGSWANDSPAQLAMIGYFNLHIIWLKLMIPWRFFRLWALMDGIDPPENMLRCMSNNFSALAFWRAWHRSFNRWIVRYIYIPLGGARRPLVNKAAVFTFVALWHDISLKLLAWGWLVVLFVIPEIVAKKLFRRFRARPTLYRTLAAAGGLCNCFMMMAANLVGFAIGLDGLKEMVRGVFGSINGAAFVATACMAVFVGVQVMFEVREHEKRAGIDLKC